MYQFPFGKYKGQDVDSVPIAYLKWFEENVTCEGGLKNAIKDEIKIREDNETSIGRNPESPSYKSLEELIFDTLQIWFATEEYLGRVRRSTESRGLLDLSLRNLLKTEIPRLKKLHREQGK